MFTDAVLEIMIPLEVDLNIISLHRNEYELNGKKYYQANAEGKFGRNFVITTVPEFDTRYITKHLPLEYQRMNWQVLELKGEGPGIFEESLVARTNEEQDYGLKDLLNFYLGHCPKWAVTFEPQYDGFSNIFKGDIPDVLENLALCILKGYPGFMIYR